MLYVLLWVLLGSLSLNVMWITNTVLDRKDAKIYKSEDLRGMLKGLGLGLVSGPLSVLIYLWLNRKNE